MSNNNNNQEQEEQEEIYAIKWYKDDEEFYRFLPNATPKVSIYDTNGIQLDVSYIPCEWASEWVNQHAIELAG